VRPVVPGDVVTNVATVTIITATEKSTTAVRWLFHALLIRKDAERFSDGLRAA
jgi:hypothetical protein